MSFSFSDPSPDRLLLDHLESELERAIETLDMTQDEIARCYADMPESHVFTGADFEHEDDYESIGLVMDRDVAQKIAFLRGVLSALADNPRADGGILDGAEGYADMIAEMAAERRAGC